MRHHIKAHLFVTFRSKDNVCASSMILLTLAMQLTSWAAKRWGRLTFRGGCLPTLPACPFDIISFEGHTSEKNKQQCMNRLPSTFELRSETDTTTLRRMFTFLQTSSLLFLLSLEINTTPESSLHPLPAKRGSWLDRMSVNTVSKTRPSTRAIEKVLGLQHECVFGLNLSFCEDLRVFFREKTRKKHH